MMTNSVREISRCNKSTVYTFYGNPIIKSANQEDNTEGMAFLQFRGVRPETLAETIE